MYDANQSILDRREQLRVKSLSLRAEALIIRHEERKTRGVLREELYLHRIGIVRSEARHSHLAYAWIRGKTWKNVEPITYAVPDWKRVEALVKKYGNPKGNLSLDEFKHGHKVSSRNGTVAQLAEHVGP